MAGWLPLPSQYSTTTNNWLGWMTRSHSSRLRLVVTELQFDFIKQVLSSLHHSITPPFSTNGERLRADIIVVMQGAVKAAKQQWKISHYQSVSLSLCLFLHCSTAAAQSLSVKPRHKKVLVNIKICFTTNKFWLQANIYMNFIYMKFTTFSEFAKNVNLFL